MTRRPVAWLVALTAVALCLGGALWWVDGSPPSGAAEPVPAASRPPAGPGRAVAVLHAWDRARAHAYATGDPADLRTLYLPGSVAGTADQRLLRDYLDRGIHVDGMRMQLLAVTVLDAAPRRLRLKVTDRLQRAVAVAADGTRTPLPRDQASTSVLTLRRQDGRWRMASVVAPGPGGRVSR